MASKDTPNLAGLIDSTIIALRRQGTVTAKDIANRAGIRETTLSMIRKGHRGVSREVAVKVAQALNLDPNDVLTAAGYAAFSFEPSIRPVVQELRTADWFLDVLRDLPSDSVVWSFGLGFVETIDDHFLDAFRNNFTKGVGYLFFVGQRNALDFVKLRDLLRSDGIELDPARCNAIVLPDESFHHRNLRVLKYLFKLSDGTRRGFATRNEIDGDYLYGELNGPDLTDLEYYLEQLQRKAQRKESDSVPMFIGDWLRSKGYQFDLSTD